jgi:hypothetical protein
MKDIKQLLMDLEAFKSICVSGREVFKFPIGKNARWILSTDELKALDIVISVLKDCGANDE